MPDSEFGCVLLDAGKPIDIQGDEWALEFDVWNRPQNIFGTVLRLLTDGGNNIDLIYSAGEGDVRYPMLAIGEETHILTNEVKTNGWMKVRLTLYPRQSKLQLDYDGETIQVKHPCLEAIKNARVSFGNSPFIEQPSSNVASINLRNVEISSNHALLRRWKMAFHEGDTCMDEVRHQPATGEKVRWLLDSYISWKSLYSRDCKTPVSVAFDSLTATFYLANDAQQLYVFHAQEQKEDVITMKGGQWVTTYPNQLIYLQNENSLLSFNLDENLYARYNPATSCWEAGQTPELAHKQYYWNNTWVYNEQDSSIVSFGGYGHYHFNNWLLYTYIHRGKEYQKKFILNQIDPRHSSSSVIVDDSLLYIFGGRGCPSGKQEMVQRNYYDLYAVNLKTQQLRCLWKMPAKPAEGGFLPSINMVYDREKECFYCFSTQQGGCLLKIDKNRPEIEVMSLPFHMDVNVQYLYTNLYYSAIRKKLYAVFQKTLVTDESHIDIYELNYPPIAIRHFVQKADEVQKDAEGSSAYFSLWWTGLLLLAAVAVLLMMGFYGRAHSKRRGRQAVTQDKPELAAAVAEEHDRQQELPAGQVEDESRKEEVEMPRLEYYPLDKSCVCFLGGFRVMDKAGEEITSYFSPTLKLLLVLLILSVGKDPKGIIGHRLIQLLWSDKSEESAKNNRNVYISKLRGVLERVGDVKIVNSKGFWSIEFGEGVLCDYLEALRLFRVQDEQNLDPLLELLLHGIMLPNVENDWVDTYKTEFSNYTIDFLTRLLEREDLPDSFLLRVADVLFQHDFINEDALRMKCRILCRQGKKGLAKNVYDAFRKDYVASLGVECSIQLQDLI
ncbi:MAG: hypothetical protein ACI378_03350 [Bacteroides sp.]